jgi:two-component system, OmpR family, sensor histidine kinase ArlS
MLLLCWAIYFYSAQNRVVQFQERLYRKAYSTAVLLKSQRFNADEVKAINESGNSSLFRKSINVYDAQNNLVFTYRDPDALPLVVNNAVLRTAKERKKYFFGWDGRDAVAVNYKDAVNEYTVIVASYDNDRVEWLSKLQAILAVCFFGSISIVIITGYVFSLGLVSSIRNLTNRINRISADNFLYRLDTGSGKDELQQLGTTINELLDRLQRSFDTQRRFIANASHELSTPLLDVALQRERTNEEYKKIIKSIKDDAKRLGLLVKSLLEIAKASDSTGGIELTSVRIDELLMGIPTEMKKISKLYEVELVFDEFPEEEDQTVVYGNMPLLYSAIKNIIHNACKFSPDKTAFVKLSFTSTAKQPDIWLGPGVGTV